ncbi:MAG: plastocyanin/azurin family copper-binding protein [Candidatus Dormibacteria bacterium]
MNHPIAGWATGRIIQLLSLGGTVAALAACGGGYAAATNPASTVGSPSPTSASSFGAPTPATEVTISNFAFAPRGVTVKVGSEITWTNRDADAHTVTFDVDGKGSAAFQSGEFYRQKMTIVGTYSYHCSLHPYMVGEVVVTAA